MARQRLEELGLTAKDIAYITERLTPAEEQYVQGLAQDMRAKARAQILRRKRKLLAS